MPNRRVSIWTGGSDGVADPDDPEVVTISWSVKEGVVIEDVTVFEGTMLAMRVRVPESIRSNQQET